MVRTRMIPRIVSDQRRKQHLQQLQQQRLAAKPGPSGVPRKPPVARRARARASIKNIKGRIHNKTFKIKKLIVQPKNVDVKKNSQVVRKMTARRRAIFPGEPRGGQY